MPFVTVAEGFVTRCAPNQGRRSIAVGPRIVALPGGELLCSCMVTSALGTNDFLPVLYRSMDLGRTWTEQGPTWPHLQERWSIFASISRDAADRLFLFGSRTPIDQPGESFWSEATQGLKPNELIWSRSVDDGWSWTGPAVIPMPLASGPRRTPFERAERN